MEGYAASAPPHAHGAATPGAAGPMSYGSASAAGASLAPPPPPGTAAGGLHTREKKIGLYIGLGALVLVVGVCLLGDLLCVVAYNLR